MSEDVHLPVTETWQPTIVAFFCNWCTYTASDLAGTARMSYAPNTRVIRVMCSGRIDAQFILSALRRGADGVLIGGCHPGDCHYREGNYKALRRFILLKKYLAQLGVEEQRVRLAWIAASEGDRVQKVTNEMVEQIRPLGPFMRGRLPQRIAPQPAAEPTPAPSVTPPANGKPKVGFYWCASCGGCEESVVDLAEGLLDVVDKVDFVFFPVAMDFKRSDVEAMEDGEMAVCFINGAIRSSEQREMAELLRRKSQVVIAYGSCSYQGGIPGLANLYEPESLLSRVYDDNPSTVNPEHARPQECTSMPEGDVHLPTLDPRVQTLDQTVPVDYYIPGCAPPVKLLAGAVEAVLSGNLPAPGSVLAPDMALCHECPRLDTKPQDLQLTRFYRPQEIEIDPETCLLAQGLACLGPATRGGCDAACIQANMPCTGCLGPLGRVADHAGAAIDALSSVLEATDERSIEEAIQSLPDAVGLFTRYGLPASMLFARRAQNGHAPADAPSETPSTVATAAAGGA